MLSDINMSLMEDSSSCSYDNYYLIVMQFNTLVHKYISNNNLVQIKLFMHY